MENPANKLRRWYHFETCFNSDANVVTLVTGNNNARSILIKSVRDGLRFYTSYTSTKAIDISENKAVTLHFYFTKSKRSVTVKGTAEKVSKEESEAYFFSRPYLSKIASHASKQSYETTRIELLCNVIKYMIKYPTTNVPIPETWGGYKVTPTEYKFLEMNVGRLHLVQKYTLSGDLWCKTIISP